MDVLGKPYVILSIMALFFFIGISLPRILHPVPSSEITPVIFPNVCVSTKYIGHKIVVNVTNNMNRTVLIEFVRIRDDKVHVNKALLPRRVYDHLYACEQDL